jgi:hypothetical protein
MMQKATHNSAPIPIKAPIVLLHADIAIIIKGVQYLNSWGELFKK